MLGKASMAEQSLFNWHFFEIIVLKGGATSKDSSEKQSQTKLESVRVKLVMLVEGTYLWMMNSIRICSSQWRLVVPNFASGISRVLSPCVLGAATEIYPSKDFSWGAVVPTYYLLVWRYLFQSAYQLLCDSGVIALPFQRTLQHYTMAAAGFSGVWAMYASVGVMHASV